MLSWLTNEIPSRPLGLARAIMGLAALIRGLIDVPVLIRLADPETVLAPHFEWFPQPNMALVVVLICVWATSASAFALGWHTTVSGVVLAATIGTTLAIDQQLYANHLYLMFWLVALLTLADAGAGLNIRRVDRPVVRWPVFLLMAQVSVVYGFSGLTKLNEDYLSGSVLAAVLRGGVVDFPDALRTPAVLTTVAAASVVVELFVAIFIWRPRFRPAAFILGLGLHLSITFLMAPTSQLLVFSLEMLALYPLFLSIGRLKLVTASDCDACQGLLKRVARFDVLDTVDVSAVETDTSHVYLDHLGETTHGSTAIGHTREHLVPHLWVAPLLRLPGIKQLGKRTYSRRHRSDGQ